MSEIKFYNLPYHICSCRDEKNEPTKIARRYKEFYELFMKNNDATKTLNMMNIKRMCCRKRLLLIPILPMIDRNKDRYFDDTKADITREDTRILEPKIAPPDFPLLGKN